MLDKKSLFALAKQTARAIPNAPVAYSFGDNNFSYTELNDLLRSELNELGGTYTSYRANKNTIFELIETVVDDVLPKKVMEQYGMFAEVKTYGQGDRPIFTQKITTASKRRAKQFITRVGLAGIYEVFKLDGSKYEIKTNAYGGAAQIAFEEFLDGRVQMADVLDIVLEGLDEQVYIEIANALMSITKHIPAANVVSTANFDEAKMDKLISIADSYGQAVIYCPFEFAATMVPSKDWVSEEMKNQKWNNGYLANYKGHKVVVFDQSYVDETNTKKVIDPSRAWIIATGAEKPVKIALEGQTIVRDIDNADMSKEIQIYKKMGVGIYSQSPNICTMELTSLKG